MKVFEQELNIELLIQYAEQEKLWLPEFQRPFVWDKTQIRLLIDSLYHNYTISSILLWEGGDELARRRVGGSIKEIKVPEDKPETVIYLLDGQQRTTALTLAFTNKAIYHGSNIKKKELLNIYWDSEYKGDDPELRWVLDDEQIFSPDDAEEHIYLRDLTQEEIFQKFGVRFVKLKHAYNWKDNSTAVLPQMNNDPALFVQYMNKINDLQKNILNRKVYDIEQQGSLEQVLEVFERINTRNTKLSIFDIMVAKTYRKIGDRYFDLRSYLSLINYEGSVKQDYFQNLDDIDLNGVGLKVEEGDMLFLVMIMLKKEFRASGILKIKTDELITNTKPLHDKFNYLLGLLRQQFLIEKEEFFKYQPIMKFLAAAVVHFPKINLQEQEFLKRWFWNTLLKNRYPGAQNERIAKDFKYIQEHTLPEALEKMVLENTRDFSYIERAKADEPAYFEAYYSNKTQQLYRSMVLLLKSRGVKDFYSGLEPVKSGTSAHFLEEHHIFPKNSKVGKDIQVKYENHRYNDIINNIANIALLTKETNNARIKAKNPSQYILQFEKEYSDAGKQQEFIAIMQTQFITAAMIDLLKADDFEGFLKARTDEILKEINKLCDIKILQPNSATP
jgi:hypothetical protein